MDLFCVQFQVDTLRTRKIRPHHSNDSNESEMPNNWTEMQKKNNPDPRKCSIFMKEEKIMCTNSWNFFKHLQTSQILISFFRHDTIWIHYVWNLSFFSQLKTHSVQVGQGSPPQVSKLFPWTYGPFHFWLIYIWKVEQ